MHRAGKLKPMPWFAFAGARPGNLGVRAGRLSPCPCAPNCVSSDADDIDHNVPAYELAVSCAEGWSAVKSAVGKLPRTIIARETEGYLHAECRSAFFGFVDDLELFLRADKKTIAVRSAARRGYSDFGVNRKRVENLRWSLRRAGVIL